MYFSNNFQNYRRVAAAMNPVNQPNGNNNGFVATTFPKVLDHNVFLSSGFDIQCLKHDYREHKAGVSQTATIPTTVKVSEASTSNDVNDKLLS